MNVNNARALNNGEVEITWEDGSTLRLHHEDLNRLRTGSRNLDERELDSAKTRSIYTRPADEPETDDADALDQRGIRSGYGS